MRRPEPGGRLLPALLSLALALGALGLVEAGLRAFGAPPASRLPYQRLVLPVLEHRGAVLATTDPRVAYQELPDQAGYRVVVLGGSAAAGLGYGPNAAFARHLEALLRQDGRDAAVLNLGLVAASSREVRALAADVLATTTPELLLVYSGNNEYLEPVSARYAWAVAGPVDRLRLLAAGSRLFGLWRDLLAPAEPPGPLPRVSGAEMDRRVILSGAEHQAVVAAYEANLRALVRNSTAPVMLATVAVNRAWAGDATHRQATPALAEVVRRVAAEEGAMLCDLAARDDLAGPGVFYDHIHFSPWGAALAGAALHACLGGSADPAARLAALRVLPEHDALDVTAWLGVDPAREPDPDLWKYDRLVAALDARLAADPADFEALVHRGNAAFFTRDGAGQARELWQRALALRDEPAVRANLARLAAQAR